jgi:hypothetical protein
MYDVHDSISAGDSDAASNCTRISIEADKPAHDSDEGELIVVPNQDEALNDPMRVKNALPPASPESEPIHSLTTGGTPGQQALDVYLAHLQRAQEEQERLEEELETKRLNEELGLSNQAQVSSRDLPQVEDRQNSPPLTSDGEQLAHARTDGELTTPSLNLTNPDPPPVPLRDSQLRDSQLELTVDNGDEARKIIRKSSTHQSSTDDSATAEAVLPQTQKGRVEIHFWAFERE